MWKFIKYVVCLAVVIGGSTWVICDTLIAATDATRLREVVKETTVTNDWDQAVKLYNDGEQLDGYFKSVNYLTFTNSYLFVSGATSSLYEFSHTCPTCSVAHVKDWPKSNDVFRAVQQRIDTTIYHGTNEVVKTVRYSHPTKKVIETTIETLTVATNVTTAIKGVSLLTEVITSNKVSYVEDK